MNSASPSVGFSIAQIKAYQNLLRKEFLSNKKKLLMFMFKYILYFGMPFIVKACFRLSLLSNIVSVDDCLAQGGFAVLTFGA
jgi:hypothetical protein